MSWEYDFTLKAVCPCGEGELVEEVYSDYWNRTDNRRSIECANCRMKYHFETKRESISGEIRESVYLVENGKTLSVHFSTINFAEDVANCYLYSELQQVGTILSSATSSQKAQNTLAEYAVKRHRDRYKTVKIATIREHIAEALDNYFAIECNKENVIELQKECDKAEKYRVIFSHFKEESP